LQQHDASHNHLWIIDYLFTDYSFFSAYIGRLREAFCASMMLGHNDL
jgi:hypothetical protein